MQNKKCRQCGEIKPIGNFRSYYTGKGNYTICKSCEKINSRAKYLERKGDKATDADKSELAKIYELYEQQRICGLRPPRRRKDLQKNIEAFDEIISKYKAVSVAGPEELTRWLTEELTDVPEYYLDTVYEQLVKLYRPVLRIDTATHLPVYDDTHVATLNRVLERFNNYEDEYYGG